MEDQFVINGVCLEINSAVGASGFARGLKVLIYWPKFSSLRDDFLSSFRMHSLSDAFCLVFVRIPSSTRCLVPLVPFMLLECLNLNWLATCFLVLLPSIPSAPASFSLVLSSVSLSLVLPFVFLRSYCFSCYSRSCYLLYHSRSCHLPRHYGLLSPENFHCNYHYCFPHHH